MKFYSSQRIGQPLQSWKDPNLSDVKNIFIAKNVLNSDFKNSQCITTELGSMVRGNSFLI